MRGQHGRFIVYRVLFWRIHCVFLKDNNGKRTLPVCVGGGGGICCESFIWSHLFIHISF